MRGIALDFPPLENEADFESLVLALLRAHLPSQDLKKYARRGEKQDGVDLLGTRNAGGIVGVQCKLRNAKKALKQRELLEEIGKAKGFPASLAHFFVASTASRDRALQRVAAEITEEHRRAGLFTVEIFFWEDLKDLLQAHSVVAEQFYGRMGPPPDEPTAGPVQPRAIVNTPTTDEHGTSHADIDEAAGCLRAGQPEVAIHLLERLRMRKWSSLTRRERYRVRANLGYAKLAKGQRREASIEFVSAGKLEPDDESAQVLEALGC